MSPATKRSSKVESSRAVEPLGEYRRKRDVDRTPEPSGERCHSGVVRERFDQVE